MAFKWLHINRCPRALLFRFLRLNINAINSDFETKQKPNYLSIRAEQPQMVLLTRNICILFTEFMELEMKKGV